MPDVTPDAKSPGKKPLGRMAYILTEVANFKPEDYGKTLPLPVPQPPREEFLYEEIAELIKSLETRATSHTYQRKGPFDFSDQAQLLHIALEAAVPLWSAQLCELGQRISTEHMWEVASRWAHAATQCLAEHGDALMFRQEGKSAEAFNHLARGLAVMAFCPGGVKAFGSHWEYRAVMVTVDTPAGPWEKPYD